MKNTGQRQVRSTCSYKQATDAAQETLSNLLHSVKFAVVSLVPLIFLNAALASPSSSVSHLLQKSALLGFFFFSFYTVDFGVSAAKSAEYK